MARTTTKPASAKKAATKSKPALAAKRPAAKTKIEPVAAVRKPVARVVVRQPQTVNPVRLLAELLGTFILTLVIISLLSGKFGLSLFVPQETIAEALKNGQPVDVPTFSVAPFVIGMTLSVLVLAFHRISGAVLNPAISIGQMLLRKVRLAEGLGYILAQVLGAMLALSVAIRLITTTNRGTGEQTAINASNLFSHQATWSIFSAEALGALIFGLGIAAAIASTRLITKALLIGGAFVLGMAIATAAGAGILNPAVAVGVGVIGMGPEGSNLWALAGIYLGGSTLGIVIGMALYELLNRNTKKNEDEEIAI